MVTVVIAAAGQGKRMGGGINKVFIPLLQHPVLTYSIVAFAACDRVTDLIVVAARDEVGQVRELLSELTIKKNWQVVEGGSERQHSIANALKVIPREAEIIVVHDGARPIVDSEIINCVIDEAYRYKAAGVGVPVKDTIKRVNAEGFIIDTPPREMLWAIQTPQAFDARLLKDAYEKAAKEGYRGTDDASLVERLGVPVRMVNGSYRNIKITTPEDKAVAELFLGKGCEDT